MLLWPIEAAGVSLDLVETAKRAAAEGSSLMQKSGAIRKCVTWAVVHDTLWNQDSSERIAGM